MKLLENEEKAAQDLVPELTNLLRGSDLMELERGGYERVGGIFREYGKPGLLVSKQFGGDARSLTDFLKMLSYTASRCPSMAIMMTMHHHTVAAFNYAGEIIACNEWLLDKVTSQNALVASAFAEGRPSAGVFQSTVLCRKEGDTYILNGNKKPCSLTHIADYALVGINSKGSGDADDRGVAVVDMNTPGIKRETFWNSDVLIAADSNKIIFDNTAVPLNRVFVIDQESPDASALKDGLEWAENVTLCLFQLMVSAAYLGMSYYIADECFMRKCGSTSLRSDIATKLISSSMLLEYLGGTLNQDSISEEFLAHCLIARQTIMDNVESVVAHCIKALGGMYYLNNETLRYLVLATKCFNFHPLKRDVSDGLLELAFSYPNE